MILITFQQRNNSIPPSFMTKNADNKTPPISNACNCINKEPKSKQTWNPTKVHHYIAGNSYHPWYSYPDDCNQPNVWMNEPNFITHHTFKTSYHTNHSNSFVYASIYAITKELMFHHKQINPLFKVYFVLDQIMDVLLWAWIAGEKITCDESMIKYCGCIVAMCKSCL